MRIIESRDMYIITEQAVLQHCSISELYPYRHLNLRTGFHPVHPPMLRRMLWASFCAVSF